MKKRILILDDDTSLQELMQVLLDYEGYETVSIERTDDLKSLVRLHKPSLIILDLYLEGISGGEWCAKLKSDAEFMAIPIMIYTAGSFNGVAKGSYGCDDFIPKPFDLTDLMSHIKSLTDMGYKVTQNYLTLRQTYPSVSSFPIVITAITADWKPIL